MIHTTSYHSWLIRSLGVILVITTMPLLYAANSRERSVEKPLTQAEERPMTLTTSYWLAHRGGTLLVLLVLGRSLLKEHKLPLSQPAIIDQRLRIAQGVERALARLYRESAQEEIWCFGERKLTFNKSTLTLPWQGSELSWNRRELIKLLLVDMLQKLQLRGALATANLPNPRADGADFRSAFLANPVEILCRRSAQSSTFVDSGGQDLARRPIIESTIVTKGANPLSSNQQQFIMAAFRTLRGQGNNSESALPALDNQSVAQPLIALLIYCIAPQQVTKATIEALWESLLPAKPKRSSRSTGGPSSCMVSRL